MRCAEVTEQLGAYVTQESAAPLDVRRHLASCEACRTEHLRYKQLVGSLGALRERVPVEPPADLLANLVSIPEHQTRTTSVKVHVTRNKKAYIGGIAAVAVAGAGAALWRSRRAA